MEELIKVFECEYFNINLYQVKNIDKYKITLSITSNNSIYGTYFNYINNYLQYKNMKKDLYTYNEVIDCIKILINEEEFTKFIHDKVIINKQKSLINDIDNIINNYKKSSDKSKVEFKEKPKTKIPLKQSEKNIEEKKQEKLPNKQKEQINKSIDEHEKIDNSFIDALFGNIDSIYSQYQQENFKKSNEQKEQKKELSKDDDYKLNENDMIGMVKNIIGQINNINEKEETRKINDEDIHIIPFRFMYKDNQFIPVKGEKQILKSEQILKTEPKQEKKDKPLEFKEPIQKKVYYSPETEYSTLSKDELEKILSDALKLIT